MHGDFTMLLPHDERVYAFCRRLDDVELLVLANMSGDDIEVAFSDAARWQDPELVLDNLGRTRPASGVDRWSAPRSLGANISTPDGMM